MRKWFNRLLLSVCDIEPTFALPPSCVSVIVLSLSLSLSLRVGVLVVDKGRNECRTNAHPHKYSPGQMLPRKMLTEKVLHADICSPTAMSDTLTFTHFTNAHARHTKSKNQYGLCYTHTHTHKHCAHTHAHTHTHILFAFFLSVSNFIEHYN